MLPSSSRAVDHFTLSKFIPLLNDGASVVLLSSNTTSMNGVNSSVYSSGKAALNAVMKIAALELAPRRIRVNAVSPGPTKTEILNKPGLDQAARKGLDDRKDPAENDRYDGRCRPDGGDGASFITGAEVVMDGGMSLA